MPEKMTTAIAGVARSYTASRRSPRIIDMLGNFLILILDVRASQADQEIGVPGQPRLCCVCCESILCF